MAPIVSDGRRARLCQSQVGPYARVAPTDPPDCSPTSRTKTPDIRSSCCVAASPRACGRTAWRRFSPLIHSRLAGEVRA